MTPRRALEDSLPDLHQLELGVVAQMCDPCTQEASLGYNVNLSQINKAHLLGCVLYQPAMSKGTHRLQSRLWPKIVGAPCLLPP